MKILMILSGGLDSTTALYELKEKHEIVEALTLTTANATDGKLKVPKKFVRPSASPTAWLICRILTLFFKEVRSQVNRWQLLTGITPKKA